MHRDSIDRFEVQTIPTTIGHKRLGSYLIEAGLINEAQVSVALNDQEATGMKFGEVLATRGWIKQQTIEYLMKKVVLPERKAKQRKAQQAGHGAQATRPPSANVSTVKVLPNQNRRPSQPARSASPTAARSSAKPSAKSSTQAASEDPSFTRREAPITKPLPPVSSGDGDVSWVG